MEECLERLAVSLRRRGYEVSMFQSGKEAVAYLNRVIDGKSIGIGGSKTVQQLGLAEQLREHNELHWQWMPEPDVYQKAARTQIYLLSANGVAESGELINIDEDGNRVASALYGHEKVYFILGINKVAPTFEAALARARNVAAVKNAQRLGVKTPCAVNGGRCVDCRSPERICQALVVLWGPTRGMENPAEVVLINETLGF